MVGYKLKFKPGFVGTFIASNVAMILRPVRMVLYVILVVALSWLVLSLSDNIKTQTLIIYILLVIPGSILVLELTVIFKILFRSKLVRQEVELDFLEDNILTKRKGVETKFYYESIKKFFPLGRKVFIIPKERFYPIGWFQIKDEDKFSEVLSFLNSKI